MKLLKFLLKKFERIFSKIISIKSFVKVFVECATTIKSSNVKYPKEIEKIIVHQVPM